MVDPFFQKAGQSPNVGQPAPQQQTNTQAAQKVDAVLNQQQIQQILQQQQLLQQQYNQLAAMLQNPKLPDTQKQQVYQQAQQLSAQYQQNNKNLEALGYNPNHVNKPTVVQKPSGSKLSMKGFLIGCFVLLIVLVGGLVGIFYYLINNPAQLSSVGLDPETTRNLLQVFSVTFFGLVIFLAMGMLVVNGYRLVSVKNKSKIGYGFGLLFGFILFVGGIFLGSRVLDMIKNISVDSVVDNNRLIVTKVYFKEGYINSNTPGVSLIAPSLMSFELNTSYFNGQILPSFGQAKFNQIILDCGNGQSIPMNMSTAKFEGSCIYFNKGEYSMNLNVDYVNVPTGERMQKDVPAGSIVFVSEVSVSPVDGNVTYNDANTEMIVGKVPSKIRFDASSVFRDFSLQDYKVIWDADGDGEVDKQNASTFTYTYKKAQLYAVTVRFPDLSKYGYVFPLRVEQSDVPVCEILATNTEGTSYNFNLQFLESTANVVEYQYLVLDGKKTLANTKSRQTYFDYEFPSAGIYSLKVEFITDEGKKGSCESEDIEVGATDFKINYDLSYKSPGSPKFTAFNQSGLNTFVNNIVTISEIPTVIQLNLISIIPNNPRAIKKISLDGLPILSTDNKNFEFTIDSPNEHIVEILVEDSSTNAKTVETFSIYVNRDSIIGRLIIKPDSVGTSPFTVTLDASTTTLNDPEDEIVYFTWDFGDGEIKKNISQSVVQHVYNYDQTKENGTFNPKVTITTKKGITKEILLPVPVIVKKQTIELNIVLDSHPGQIARVNDRVPMSLSINGLPKRIYWDFGNGKILECNGRECVSTSTVYDTPGTYTIKAKVTFDDRPEVEGSINIKVN
ncbi:MAG: PKD domain-containing protein [Candidatus Absconditabacteria bacterium]|nr:PKD domain-containing protein [Candidatus Absconditabacteria bacterium]